MTYISRIERIGREEGWKAGHADGHAEALRTTALRLASKRFEALPESATQRIGSLAPAQLEELIMAIFDFATRADLEAWLAAQPDDSSHEKREELATPPPS